MVYMSIILLAASTGASAAQISDCKPAEGFEFICGLNEPEDLVGIPGTPWVLASDLAQSRERGDVYLIDKRDRSVRALEIAAGAAEPRSETYACDSPPDPQQFTSHGLTVGRLESGELRLLVVNHGEREAIEIFNIQLSDAEPEFTWTGCIVMPDGADANSVAHLPDGGILITSLFNIHDKGVLDKVDRVAKAEPSGAIWEWYPDRGFRQIPLPQISGANGIDVTPDGRSIFVNGWAEKAIYKLDRFGASPPIRITVNFMPDNLHLTESGQVLVAGHDTDPAEGFACMQAPDRPKYCIDKWGAAMIDPDTMEITMQWEGKGRGVFGDVTTAYDAGDELWLSSLSGDRIAIIEK